MFFCCGCVRRLIFSLVGFCLFYQFVLVFLWFGLVVLLVVVRNMLYYCDGCFS